MKTLIIGGTSSIGIKLKSELSQLGEVITTGRKNADIIMDLNDLKEKVILPEGIDVIVHTAANFGGLEDDQIFEAENVNVLGTLKICQASLHAKVKHIIFISSIYSDSQKGTSNFSIYSLSKKHAEEVALYYCGLHSISLTILKPSPIYGSGDRFAGHHPFFYSIIDKAKKGEDIELYGSHDALRNYIHIEDLVTIIIKVIQQKVEGVYSCVHPDNSTLTQISKAALKVFSSNASILFLKEKPNVPDNIFEQDNVLYKKINFFPRISIEEGIKKIMIHQAENT